MKKVLASTFAVLVLAAWKIVLEISITLKDGSTVVGCS
jgi:hypothetical protein